MKENVCVYVTCAIQTHAVQESAIFLENSVAYGS